MKFYVQPALPKEQRERELRKQMFKYKFSKKRCNLYVRNLPEDFSEEALKNLFGQFGEIESCKILLDNKSAFVCFKTPDCALNAKEKMHEFDINGKKLYVNHYEMKELRKA